MSDKKVWHQRTINEFYTLGEEVANGITHGIGAVLSIAALIILVSTAVVHGTAWHVASFSVYGASLILLFTASTLYHSVQHPRLRPILRRLDHASIYLLIAGTYTPFTLTSLRGPWGWSLFAVVWGIALLGILFKLFFIGRLEVLSTLAYLGMGWLGPVAYRELMAQIPANGLTWLIAGGVTYTLGVLFYAIERLPYNHAAWHVFVLAGSTCHFFAVFSLLTVTL